LELRNVTASVAPPEGPLLLGQSFLSRLMTWSVNNQTHVLYMNQPDNNQAPQQNAQLPRGQVLDSEYGRTQSCVARFRATNTAEADVIIQQCKQDPNAKPLPQSAQSPQRTQAPLVQALDPEYSRIQPCVARFSASDTAEADVIVQQCKQDPNARP
jgi:hypothetical protein